MGGPKMPLGMDDGSAGFEWNFAPIGRQESFFGLALAVTILGPDMSTDRWPMGGKKYLKKNRLT